MLPSGSEFNINDVIAVYYKKKIKWYEYLWYVITFQFDKLPRYTKLKGIEEIKIEMSKENGKGNKKEF